MTYLTMLLSSITIVLLALGAYVQSKRTTALQRRVTALEIMLARRK